MRLPWEMTPTCRIRALVREDPPEWDSQVARALARHHAPAPKGRATARLRGAKARERAWQGRESAVVSLLGICGRSSDRSPAASARASQRFPCLGLSFLGSPFFGAPSFFVGSAGFCSGPSLWTEPRAAWYLATISSLPTTVPASMAALRLA